jgi:hypothetical protein|tara:strand:+ start:1823 stop:2044 length:222 start_codon:yes stop_codon:yes gene_type:complete
MRKSQEGGYTYIQKRLEQDRKKYLDTVEKRDPYKYSNKKEPMYTPFDYMMEWYKQVNEINNMWYRFFVDQEYR